MSVYAETLQRFTLAAFVAAGAAAFAQSAAATDEESRWLRNIRQVTSTAHGLDRAGEAYFSPDGRRICFQAYPAGKSDYQIYVMDLPDGKPQMVSTGTGATTCAYFHPDGNRLLFGSNHLDPRPVAPPSGESPSGARSYAWSFYPGMDVFEYNLATRELRPLITAPGYDAEASYSADGKHIVFTSMRDGDQEIYVCDADGANPRRITRSKGYDGGPFFSPDGLALVYRSDRKGDGNLQIFLNTIAGDAERAITGDDVLNWCPYWHPSGKWLIFTRADHRGRPNYDLYLLSVDGKQTHRVTHDAEFDGLPVFSADGRSVLWTSKRGGLEGAQIFIADCVGLLPTGELRAGD